MTVNCTEETFVRVSVIMFSHKSLDIQIILIPTLFNQTTMKNTTVKNEKRKTKILNIMINFIIFHSLTNMAGVVHINLSKLLSGVYNILFCVQNLVITYK